jgi:small subunit ribosomal protein S15
MGVYLTDERKKEIFKTYGGDEKNTGHTEAQIALLHEKVKGLSEHLRRNQGDHHCRKNLLTTVGKRKRLLNYLAQRDIERYRELISDLGIRK